MIETILAIIIVAVVAIIVIYKIDDYKHKEFVRLYSISLKKLKELNEKYAFYEYVNFDMTHTYDNDHSYLDIACQDYLIYQLQFNQRDILNQITKSHRNNREYEKYIKEVELVEQIGEYEIPYGELNFEKLKKIEKKTYNNEILSRPGYFTILVELYCSKINGYTYAKKSRTFNEYEISELVRRLNNKNGFYYNDRYIWDAICRVERGKVSNKMRFSIYQRDGYRCCNCGVSERWAKLEIDHIIPISKGGKSTYNNLQTLCHRCNVEKGDGSRSFRYR